MTYGRGINQTSGEMTTNAECWATVNPVSITSGKTYTITLDATYLWVVNCDNSGNVVTPFLTTGTNSKPQTFTFTASSSKIKFGCYDPSKQLTYCTITEGGTPSQPITPGHPTPIQPPSDTASDTFSILAVIELTKVSVILSTNALASITIPTVAPIIALYSIIVIGSLLSIFA